MDTKTYKKDFSSIGVRMLISTAIILLVQIGTQTFALTLFPQWQNHFNILLALSMVAPLCSGLSDRLCDNAE